MKIILASYSFVSEKVNGVRVNCTINSNNHFLSILKQNIKEYNKIVFVASDFESFDKNDEYKNVYIKAFERENLNFKSYIVVDDRNCNNVQEILNGANLILLQGGDLVLQNKNFIKCNLKKYLMGLDAIIIGQSAGSMNCADVVYNYPETLEMMHESKFLQGLGFTNISIYSTFQ